MLRLRPYLKKDANIIVTWSQDERSFRQWTADRYEKFPITAEDMNNAYERWQENGNFWAMTATEGNEIVGHLIMRYTNCENTELRLGFVIVDDKKRKKGYGREMLKLATEYAFRMLHVDRITLGVFANNLSAYECYKAIGFQETGAPHNVYTICSQQWECIEMELTREQHQNSVVETVLALGDKDLSTGLYNHKGFLNKLEELRQESDSQADVWFVCIDIRGLSNINNVYGHTEGDYTVKMLAQIISESIRKNEFAAHLGGNEFVVAVRENKMEGNSSERFIHDVETRVDVFNKASDKEYSLEIMSNAFLAHLDEDTGVKKALDKALQNKRMVFEEILYAIHGQNEDLGIFSAVEGAQIKEIIEKNLFAYAFQPIVDVKTGDIYGYEALMRTQGDTGITPFSILRYATLNHSLYDIEKATFNNVLYKIYNENEIFHNKKVFINSIPGYQLNDEDYGLLASKYDKTLKQLMVEVTEQTELDDKGLNILLGRSGREGFGLAIDDYGSGYSNTSSLLRYLPNCVKIDRLLITDIQEDPKKQHFVKSIIEFAHDNGILALAEGVENSAELRAVVSMGADLIQGFYTAKPAMEVITEIPSKIRDEIVNATVNSQSETQKRIYVADGDKEISLMRLALEGYTGILLSQQDVTLVGNPEYTAGMSIRIKEGCQCRLTMRNVALEAPQGTPCIEIGKNSDLVITLDGENKIGTLGIRVPESSSLVIKGAGNMVIYAKAIRGFAIGNEPDNAVGSITLAGSGNITIHSEGDTCVGIGGGIYHHGEGIRILSGAINLEVAGSSAIGIGCFEGAIPIVISHCRLAVDIKVANGIAIGSKSGPQNIKLSSLRAEITGSGSFLTGIGSYEESDGNIYLSDGKAIVNLNGQRVGLIGALGGNLACVVEGIRLELKSEGSEVWGIGTYNNEGYIKTKNASIDIVLNAAKTNPVGVQLQNMTSIGGEMNLHINEY